MFRINRAAYLLLGFAAMSWAARAGAAPPLDPAQWVDPFIGTAQGGNTFPGALVPWGMVSVSPHNQLQAPSGYLHGESFLYGFGHTHLSGTNCPDLGSVLILPLVGPVPADARNRKSEYDLEEASPGYYRVHLKPSDILAEMTATTRAGLSQYRFPASSGQASILIDAGSRLTTDPVTVKPRFESHVKIVSPDEVEGYSQSGDFCTPYSGNEQRVYFSAKFSKKSVSAGTWNGSQMGGSREQSGAQVGAFLSFSTAHEETILVKVGISYVSVENARLNLQTEIPGWDFQAVQASARQAWNEELSKFKIKGASPGKRRIFYTALYHALIHPSVFSDVNGEYQGIGRSGVKKAEGYIRYSMFSLWASYRNLHPFLGLFYPERELDMAKSLTEMAKERKFLPRWELAGNETGVMVGCPAVPVLLDTYRQGLIHFDADSAYEAAVRSMNPQDNPIYGGLKSLLQYGYIPKDDASRDLIWGSAATSLEYAYDYWCLAQWAKDLGRKGDAEKYIHLSGLYRNLYDPQTGFFRAKNRDGSWMSPFDPLARCCDQSWPDNGGPGYVEGGAWQYLFDVPQDRDGLKLLMGGDGVFVQRLQECFDGGHYDATNEPDLTWPYLFDEVHSEAWRTQKQVREIMEKNYGTGPDGLPGNDDGGVLSAWYLFSALGFYPVCPGDNRYSVGSPIFQEVEIHTNKEFYPGGLLTLKTVNNSDRNVYVKSMLLDGIPYAKTFLTHQALVYGKTVVFQMDSQPRK